MFFEDSFLSVLNMSITSCYVIAAILLLHLALKGMPKKYSYALWSVAGFRLICPVSFKSVFSLFSLKVFNMEKAQKVNEYSLTYVKPEKPIIRDELTSGISAVNSVIENRVVPSDTFQSSYNTVLLTLALIWIIGIIALLIYSLINFIRLKKRLSTAILLEKGIYKSENISSPFIVGVIRPKIYVPCGIDGDYMQYVLSHERYHIKRFDNGFKLIAYFLLVLHWFNPLAWLAFYLFTKDMEMSCDEAVLSKNEGIKRAYSNALLSFATNKKFPAPSPLSFSENGVKARIKNVLKYKKPKAVFRAVAIILCLSLLTACAANPKQHVTEESITNAVNEIKNSIGNFDSGNVYTAGRTIGLNAVISWVRGNGYYYDKITIKKDSLNVIDNEGNEIFQSEKAKETELEIIDEQGVLSVVPKEKTHLMIEEDYRSLFRKSNLSCILYTNDSMSNEGTVSYKVYFNGGEPFAFCDMGWIYLLEPLNFNKLLSDTIIENEKERFEKGDYFGVAYRQLGMTEGDLNGNEVGKYVSVYLYAEVAWLSVDRSGMYERLVKTSGGEGPALAVFEKNGNEYSLKEYSPINVDYHSEEVKKNFSEGAYNSFEKLGKNDFAAMDKELYNYAADKYLFGADVFILGAFESWDTTDKTFEDYQTLINFGTRTLEHCFGNFLTNDYLDEETERKYMLIVEDLLGSESIGVNSEGGRAYFEQLLEKNRQLLKSSNPEDMKRAYPNGYLLLTITGDIDENADSKDGYLTYNGALSLIGKGAFASIKNIRKDYKYNYKSGSQTRLYYLQLADDMGHAEILTNKHEKIIFIQLYSNNGELADSYVNPNVEYDEVLDYVILFAYGEGYSKGDFYKAEIKDYSDEELGEFYLITLRMNERDKSIYVVVLNKYTLQVMDAYDKQNEKDVINRGKKLTLEEAKAFIKNAENTALSELTDYYECTDEGSGIYALRFDVLDYDGYLMVYSYGSGNIDYIALYSGNGTIVERYSKGEVRFE